MANNTVQVHKNVWHYEICLQHSTRADTLLIER